MRGIGFRGKIVAVFRLGVFLARVGEACTVKKHVDRNKFRKSRWSQMLLTGQSLFVMADILILQSDTVTITAQPYSFAAASASAYSATPIGRLRT